MAFIDHVIDLLQYETNDIYTNCYLYLVFMRLFFNKLQIFYNYILNYEKPIDKKY